VQEGAMMGTNYYVIKDKCECCNRSTREYHIGKLSYGWAFSFQGYPWVKLTSWKQWKEFLKDQLIEDEYGDHVTYEELVRIVEQFASPHFVNSNGRKNLQHNTESRRSGWFDSSMDWDDEEGYSFTTREFS
jgi:hypothetical protein